MKAIRIRAQLDSTTLHLPELSGFVGRSVDIIVVEDVEGSRKSMEEALKSSPHPPESLGEALLEAGTLSRLT